METLGDVLQLLQRANKIDQMYSGEEYIRELIKIICKGLGITYALVGRPLSPNAPQIKTDFLWMDGKFEENITYDLDGTPCVNVICGTRAQCISEGVADLFPKDKMLSDLKIESYVGAPTLKPDGDLLGLVVLMDRKPLRDLPKLSFIVEFLAARVGAEYRRQEVEERLHKINSDLEILAEKRAQELTVALKRLLSQEKLATIGRITFGIAHELKNPLNVIVNASELIKDLISEGAATSDLREPADMVYNQSRRATNIITQMLKQARQDLGSVSEDVDLSHLLQRTLKMCLSSLSDHEFRSRLEIKQNIEKDVIVRLFDVPSMERVFINILDNSVYALKEKLKLSPEDFVPMIEVSLKTLSTRLILEFLDNGTGISSAHREHVFEEFYTTKPAGDGTGLGLPIAKETIEKNSGLIELESEYGHYTRIHIELPKNL